MRLIRYVRGSRDKVGARQVALAKAQNILDEAFTQIVDWTYRLNVRRDLHKRSPKQLGFADTQALRAEIRRKTIDFKKILADLA